MTRRRPLTEPREGSRCGRYTLLLGAYSPVILIVGLRALPSAVGFALSAVGMIGIGIWAFFLWRVLPKVGSYPTVVDEIEFIDSEVTGYIVSILLPVIAAPKPTTFDWAAYAVAAVLILIVAYVARLWVVNPVAYLFGYRAARAVLDGKQMIVLIKQLPAPGSRCTATGALGVKTLHPEEALQCQHRTPGYS